MQRQSSNGKGNGGTPAGRAAGETPARRRADDRGALVLIGGACDPAGAAFGRFVELAGGREGGRIVGLTTASMDPVDSARHWLKAFRDAGAPHVEIPLVDSRDRAQDARVADMLRDADGIFLGGGDQVHLVTTLGGSRVGRALADAYARGAVICGTSAGAAALTETIMAGGEPDEYGKMQDLHLGPGFGLLGFRAVIDTHFTQRRRLQRLFMVIARNGDLMGLGIDEDTAMVVSGHRGEVVGKGSVTFVDGRGVRYDNADKCDEGAALTLSYLRVGIVGAGYTLDLRERELEVILQNRREACDATILRADEALPERDPSSPDRRLAPVEPARTDDADEG
ncbi:MAG TPA: cyanophycinase [Longimicrobium sp.]|nr:cyanophycinase [Longimicrobium sp.]